MVDFLTEIFYSLKKVGKINLCFANIGKVNLKC